MNQLRRYNIKYGYLKRSKYLFDRWIGSFTGQTITENYFKIKNFELIPGSKGLPFIGNLIDFLSAGSGPQLHKYIDSRHRQFGKIFRERLGSQECVFVSSAGHMRSIFQYEGQYPTHPLPDAWNIYNEKYNRKRGLFFMNGPEWLENRRIMNRFLLVNGNLEFLNKHIQNSTDKIIKTWKIQLDEKITTNSNESNNKIEICNLESQLYCWSINVLISIMFGDAFEKYASTELMSLINDFSLNVHEIFSNSSNFMNFPPKLAETLNLKIWTEFENSVTNVLNLGNEIIDLALSEIQSNDECLITKMKEAKMSLDIIKRIFIDLIIAAGDTTAFSSQWALYLLSINSNIQNRVRQEVIDTNLNSDSEIPYIKGLIRETLRLYPVAPFIGRLLASEAIIANYKIPKDMLVLMSLFTSGRDEDHFPQPMEVQPERWIRNSRGQLNNVSQAYGTMPFAMGSRSCIGRKIALNQMHYLIAKVTQNFKINCINDKSIDIILRMVAVPNNPIRLMIENV